MRNPFLIFAAVATLLLGACVPSPESPRVERPRPQPAPDADTRQCLADLRAGRVHVRLLPDRHYGGGCSALGSVQLLDMGVPVTNLGAMTCPLARTFVRWTREGVQPAAREWLGTEVVRIESFGTYSCRSVNSKVGGRISEHGRANAVDVSAFVLGDGRRITVLDGWNSDQRRVREFLRAVHAAGCRHFNIGIGPDANAQHRNHFHFDMGRGPYCR